MGFRKSVLLLLFIGKFKSEDQSQLNMFVSPSLLSIIIVLQLIIQIIRLLTL